MAADRLLDAALRSVADACLVSRKVQRDIEKVRRIAKDDKSPVTVADFAVQAVVAMSLQQRLGKSLIVGEESTRLLRDPAQSAVLDAVINEVRVFRPDASADDVLNAIDAGGHDASGDSFWTLDPIDGTKGFLRGQQYAIALARIEHGEVVLGVMGCPNLPLDQNAPLDLADECGSIYVALKGKGAWELGGPPDHGKAGGSRVLHRSTVSSHGSIRACESVESSHSKQDASAKILQSLGAPGTPARLDSQCKYAVVARGQADVYLRIPTSKTYIEKIWDHAAGAIIAMEAGAVVSDITGAPLDFSRGRTLSANRGIVCAVHGAHERIINAIERLGIGAAA